MGWICSNCGTRVERHFKICWNCGTDRKGNIDEDFAIEPDADELEEHPETPRIRCDKCGYQGKVLFSTRHKSWPEWVLAGVISILVSQRSWIHFCHMVCPQCGTEQKNPTGWMGVPSPNADAIWAKANKLELQTYRKNKLLVYLVLGAIVSASLILWFAVR